MEDIVHELIEHSLANKTILNGDSFYTLHGLHSGFLKEKALLAKNLQSYHATIVDRYAFLVMNGFNNTG